MIRVNERSVDGVVKGAASHQVPLHVSRPLPQSSGQSVVAQHALGGGLGRRHVDDQMRPAVLEARGVVLVGQVVPVQNDAADAPEVCA